MFSCYFQFVFSSSNCAMGWWKLVKHTTMLLGKYHRGFSHEGKNAQLELSFNLPSFWWRVFCPVYFYANNIFKASQRVIWNHAAKSCSKIAVRMPWPLNCDLGAELRDLLTTSANKPHIFYYKFYLKWNINEHVKKRATLLLPALEC